MTLKKNILIIALAPSLALGAAAVAQVSTPVDITAPATESADAQVVEVRGEHRGEGRRGGHRGGRGTPLPGAFEEVDADGDGSVTQAEIDAFVAAKVAEVDADGDGGLTLDEFRAMTAEQDAEARERREARAFQMLDADASGVITAEEIEERFGGIVERMDRDGDGALTQTDGRRGDRGERGSRGDR